MKVVCVSNKRFNHQLTIGKEYEVFSEFTETWAMRYKRWYIEGDFGRKLYLNHLIEDGLVMTRKEIIEKKLNILLDIKS